MTFDVYVGHRRRTVEVERVRGALAVTLESHQLQLDVVDTGHEWSVLWGQREKRGDRRGEAPRPAQPPRSYRVVFQDCPDGRTEVHINGRAVSVTVADARYGGAAPAAAGRERHGGPQEVLAPMPGRIVKVLVRSGDRVADRQGLVIVEAMKMENELRAPRAGVVTEVRAIDGATVDAGAVLLTLA